MKATRFSWVIFITGTVTAVAQTNLSFTNLQGRAYNDVQLVGHDPISISVIRRAGYQPLRIYFTNLPDEIRAQFNYDATQEERFRARERQDARITNEFKAEEEQINSQKHLVLAEFVRTIPNGILVNLVDGASVSDVERAMSGQRPAFTEHPTSRTPAVIFKYPGDDLVTGQYLCLETYPFGNYQMAPVNGYSDQVLRITANKHDVMAKRFYDRHPNWPRPDGDSEQTRQEELEAKLRDIDPQISAAEALGILAGRHVPAVGSRTYFPPGREAVTVATKDGIPSDVYDVVAEQAIKNFPKSYDLQADYVARQVADYKSRHP